MAVKLNGHAAKNGSFDGDSHQSKSLSTGLRRGGSDPTLNCFTEAIAQGSGAMRVIEFPDDDHAWFSQKITDSYASCIAGANSVRNA